MSPSANPDVRRTATARWRAKPGVAERQRLIQASRYRALVRLAQRHPDEALELVNEERVKVGVPPVFELVNGSTAGLAPQPRGEAAPAPVACPTAAPSASTGGTDNTTPEGAAPGGTSTTTSTPEHARSGGSSTAVS